MKVIVISDSHGSTNNIIYALSREKDITTVIFLGDGIGDIEQAEEWFPEHKFICVNGNCDSYLSDNTVAYKHIEGTTIVMTHGHRFNVKVSRRELINHAKGVLAHLALYGHTHRADKTEMGDFLFINPGSISEPRDGSGGTFALLNTGEGHADCRILRYSDFISGNGSTESKKPKVRGGHLRDLFNYSDGF